MREDQPTGGRGRPMLFRAAWEFGHADASSGKPPTNLNAPFPDAAMEETWAEAYRDGYEAGQASAYALAHPAGELAGVKG